jgi:hypothetical protein
MRNAILSAVLGLGLVCTLPKASAQEGSDPKLPWMSVLVLPGMDLTDKDRLPVQQELIAGSFGHSGEGLAWQLMAYSPFPQPQKEGEVLIEVGKMIEEGKKSYRYLKLPEAQSVFQAAAKLLGRVPPAQCDRKLMAEMYFYWARTTLDAGEEAGAQALLSQIGRFDPEAGPDPAIMPPNLVAAYDIALEDRRNKPEGRILVEIVPGRGTLFVDCASKPGGVVEIKGASGSDLWVAAQIQGGTYRGTFPFLAGPRRILKIFSSRPEDDARLSGHLTNLGRNNPSIGMLQSGGNPDLDSLAEYLHVDLILVAEIRKATGGKTARLGLYVPGKGVTGAVEEVTLGDDGHLDAKKLSAALGALAKATRSPTLLAALAQSKTVTPPPPKEIADDLSKDTRDDDEAVGQTPWYMTWWFWTAAGVLVAGAVTTGVVLGTMDTGESPSGEVILTVTPP